MNRDEIGKLPDPVARLKAVAMDIGMPSTTTIDTEVIRAVLARLEDAEAALALVVERAAETALNIRGDFYGVERAAAIRALASPSGVEALAALRAERDAAKNRADGWKDSSDEGWRLVHVMRGERDDALTRLAAAEGRVAALTGLPRDYGYDGLRWKIGAAMRRSMDAAHPTTDREAALYHAFRAGLAAALATVTPPADTTEGRT